MPCSDGGPSYEQVERDWRLNSIMTRLACDRCRELEAKGGVPEWAMEWWVDHKERDARQRETIEAQRAAAAIRQTAMAKLTPKERDELGV